MEINLTQEQLDIMIEDAYWVDSGILDNAIKSLNSIELVI